jgi:integrase
MRRGELLALRWQDVDLDRAALAVRRTVTSAGNGGWGFGEAKTAAGRCSVALPASCVAALRALRARQLERRLLLGPAWVDLVFERGDGTTRSPTGLDRVFRRTVGRAGLPAIRFHDLRHTAATLMLAEGVHPKIVQEGLGHSAIAMALNLYSHVTLDLQREAADRLDAAVGG